MAQEQPDVDTLKRRGRRRLVGAVALVLLAVIVLPMVFDQEPRQAAPPVSVRIPGEDEAAPFKPAPPAPKADRKAAAPEAAAPAPGKAQAPQPADKERARAEAALAGAEQYVVQVGAFSNPDGVVAKLKAAKMPHYTERLPGNLTRVRAGPFATKEAADRALQQLKALGLTPGAVSAKSG
jgi:DedD protein